MERCVMAAGVATRYADFGKGDKVICLLHGYLESIEVWERFAGQLGKEFRVVMIDLPGHGISAWGNREAITMDFMAEVVSEVLRKAGVERCTLVGHSMGGYVVAAMAELHPEQLESVVFFHSSPSADTPDKVEFRKREIDAIRAGKKELLATVNPGRGFAPQNLQQCQEQVDELAEQIMMTDDEAIIATLNGLMERPDRNKIISSLEIPVLFIFGKFDNFIPIESAEAIIAAHPSAKVAWMENSGHNGFVEESERAVELLREFVNTAR